MFVCFLNPKFKNYIIALLIFLVALNSEEKWVILIQNTMHEVQYDFVKKYRQSCIGLQFILYDSNFKVCFTFCITE